jgi:hypothetical protein
MSGLPAAPGASPVGFHRFIAILVAMVVARMHLPHRRLRWLIRGVDRLIRRFAGIIDIDSSPDALISVAFGRAEREVRLAGGTILKPGDAIVDLHLRNEHLLRMSSRGPDLRWAKAMIRRMDRSLQRLSAHMPADQRFDGVKALRIEPALAGGHAAIILTRIVARYGFEAALDSGASPAGSWLFRVFDNFWMRLLAWTFNPVSLKRWQADRRRRAFWISRPHFIARYDGIAVSETRNRISADC